MSALVTIFEDLKSNGGLKGADLANITGVSPATVSRWISGNVSPHPKTQILISDLRYIVDRLSDYYSPRDARLWLYSRNPLLDDARPIDVINDNRAEDVIEVIEQLESGAYL